MNLSVPETPDKRAAWAYTEVEDAYLLTNTRKLHAATSAMFEFTIKDIQPHLVKDLCTGFKTDEFRAEVSVDTQKDGLLTMTSNAITAQMDTFARVTDAMKRKDNMYLEWPSNWDESWKPENADRYVYIDWYAYANIQANQLFSMDIEDDFRLNCEDAIILAMRYNGKTYEGSAAERLMTDGFYASGTGFYTHVYVAYPTEFFTGQKQKAKNEVTFKLESIDDREKTSAKAQAKAELGIQEFHEPTGHFMVHKYGLGGDSTKNRIGYYNNALNSLQGGRDVNLNYETQSIGFTLPWTLQRDWEKNHEGETGTIEPVLSDYKKETVRMETDDKDVFWNEKENGQLAEAARLTSAEEYEFQKVTILGMEVYDYGMYTQDGTGYFETKGLNGGGVVAYGTIPAGSYGYKKTDDNRPAIEVYGRPAYDSGEWIHYATVHMDGTASEAFNGAKVEGTTVWFPKGTLSWKTTFLVFQLGMIQVWKTGTTCNGRVNTRESMFHR